MYICVPCKREMRCDKNGVGADYGNGHVYPADRFKCSTCGHEILATNRTASFDPENKFQDEYLDCRERNQAVNPVMRDVVNSIS
jgi:DNA-directed RNA polymerase subunit RPC12/RpoP